MNYSLFLWLFFSKNLNIDFFIYKITFKTTCNNLNTQNTIVKKKKRKFYFRQCNWADLCDIIRVLPKLFHKWT